MSSTCYPSCPPPSTIVTHAPPVPHVAHLAYTGAGILEPLSLIGFGCITLGCFAICYVQRLRGKW